MPAQFVNFERVEDAQRAFEDKNNRVVPALTGAKQLKMRFKPSKVRPRIPKARHVLLMGFQCLFRALGISP